MFVSSWLTWLKSRGNSTRRTRRRHGSPPPLGGLRDWLLEDRLAPALSTPTIQSIAYLPPDYTVKGISFTTPQADFTSWNLYVNGTQVLANQTPCGSGGSAKFIGALGSLNLFNSFVVETSNGSQTTRSKPYIGPCPPGSSTIVSPDYDWANPPAGTLVQRVSTDRQISALVLSANKTYTIGLQDYAGGHVVPAPHFSIATNHPGVVTAMMSGSNLILDTTTLKGKAGLTSIRITDTAPGSVTRYVGVLVTDTAGIPPSSPDYLAIGAVNDNTDPGFFQTSVLKSATSAYQQYDYQYVYLNDGPRNAPLWPDQTTPPQPTDPLISNPNAWRSSSGAPDGKKLLQLLDTASQLGSIPTVVYYNIMSGFYGPNRIPIGESSTVGLGNLKNSSFMLEYFKDIKFVLDTVRAFAGGGTVALIMEPDFLGYMMKSTLQGDLSWKDPSSIQLGYDVGAVAAQAGLLPAGSSTGNPSTLVDWVKTINSGVRYLSQATVDGKLQSVQIKLGWKFNTWAADFNMPDGTGWSHGISKATDWFVRNSTYVYQGKTGYPAGLLFVQNIASYTADWYKKAGILDVLPSFSTSHGMDFMALDKYGIDGGDDVEQLTKPGYTDPDNTSWFFNADDWNNYLTYASRVRTVLSQNRASPVPIWLWQIPVGHVNSSVSINPMTGKTYLPLANSYYQVGGASFGQWEDSAVTWIFGDQFTGKTGVASDPARVAFFSTNNANDPLITSKGGVISWGGHEKALWQAGVQAVLFGPGLPFATMGGGYAGQNPRDDYFFATKVQLYYQPTLTLQVQPGATLGLPVALLATYQSPATISGALLPAGQSMSFFANSFKLGSAALLQGPGSNGVYQAALSTRAIPFGLRTISTTFLGSSAHTQFFQRFGSLFASFR